MKILFALIGLGTLAAMAMGRRSLTWEIRKRSHIGDYVSHDHSELLHTHEHAHVTHNRRQGPDMVWGEWEHLTATHEHAHNHPSVTHAHLPHEDAAHEHLGESHVHDHAHPERS
jgi:hypothetical protein